MEGKFLSGKNSGERYAALLRRAAQHRGNQCHVLSHAAAEHAGKLEGAGAGDFSLFAQSSATHHALQTTERDGRGNEVFPRTAAVLADQLGVVLFQLPPNMKKDLPRLESFLTQLPPATRAAFEFRHPTWFDDDVLELTTQSKSPLVVSDTDDMPTTHIDKTADWGYLRLRRVNYSEENLAEWVERIRSQNWKETFLFFKHEDEGTGPRLAAQFLQLAIRTTRVKQRQTKRGAMCASLWFESCCTNLKIPATFRMAAVAINLNRRASPSHEALQYFPSACGAQPQTGFLQVSFSSSAMEFLLLQSFWSA